jgi:hypothetical protein
VDITQAILLSVIVVLTIFLVVIGIQAYLTLKDLRRTLNKMSHLMDNTDNLIGQVKKPIESVGGIFTALTAGAGIAHLLKKIKKGDNKDEQSQSRK